MKTFHQSLDTDFSEIRVKPEIQEPDGFDLLTALDDIIETVYFVPLALGDALAVQFGNDSLKKLPVPTVAGVLSLIDRLSRQMPMVNPDPQGAAEAFFSGLKKEFPQVFQLWAKEDDRLVLKPIGAFNLALDRAEDLIEEWMKGQAEAMPRPQAMDLRGHGLIRAVEGFDPERHGDDRAWRTDVRKRILNAFPAVVRPGIYLDAWADYVRAVLDLEPTQELRTRWPY